MRVSGYLLNHLWQYFSGFKKMQKMFNVLLLIGYVTFMTNYSHADESDLDDYRVKLGNEWQVEKNDRARQIRTSTRQENGNRFRSFKSDFVVNASMQTVARVLFDFDNYPKWFWQVRKAHLLKTISPTEFIWYVEHDAPLNLPNRDAVLQTVIEPITATKPYAALHVSVIKNYLPERPNIVRIQEEEIKVRLTPSLSGSIKIEMQGYVDPSGIVPVWAKNLVQESAPYATSLGLRRMINLPKYRDSNDEPLFKLVD